MPNNNYILTSDGNFISEEELYHYGVKGMKWGVRKKYDEYLQQKRKRNKTKKYYDQFMNNETNAGEHFKKNLSISKNYKRSDAKLAWKQAKNKAKMDPSYKQSDEYKKAKQARNKVAAEEALESLMNPTINKEYKRSNNRTNI